MPYPGGRPPMGLGGLMTGAHNMGGLGGVSAQGVGGGGPNAGPRRGPPSPQGRFPGFWDPFGSYTYYPRDNSEGPMYHGTPKTFDDYLNDARRWLGR